MAHISYLKKTSYHQNQSLTFETIKVSEGQWAHRL